MDTRQVLLADAFATEPLSGLSVAVVPDGSGLTRSQLSRISSECGATAVLTRDEETLRLVETGGSDAVVAGAIAGGVCLFERGEIEAGRHTVDIEGTDSWAETVDIEIDTDRTAFQTLPRQSPDSPGISTERLAEAIGIDHATIEDVGADLPPARVDACGGTLLVPVNFLEHLSSARPAPGALGTVLEQTETSRLCAFTFDTLGADTAVHARFFEPGVAGCERAASPVSVAACGTHIGTNPVFEETRREMRVECGRFLDRPAIIETTLDSEPRVSGSGLTVLDGEITLPPAEDDDDIIEV